MPDQRMPQALDRVVADLAYRYDGVLDREDVAEVVAESYALLSSQAGVTEFLPVLTARFARDRLADLARSAGLAPSGTPEVLFLCVRNAGRSQMAAALMTQRSGGRVHVRSAGSAPGGSIHPVVTQAMAEIGIDLTEAYPKPLTDDVVRASDVIVAMGCGDACPVYPGKRYLDWDLPDPHDQSIEVVRAIRDRIDVHVRQLLAELLPTTSDDSTSHAPATGERLR